MAAQECSQCGARIRPDGTSPCTCVLSAAEMVDAVFDALEPRELKGPRRSKTRRDRPAPDPGAAPAAASVAKSGEDTADGADAAAEEPERQRVRRPGKGVAVGVA